MSCNLGSRIDVYFSSYYLREYAQSTMDYNLGEADSIFGILQCADRFLSYTEEDRELQWFSRYVHAAKKGGIIEIRSNGLEMAVITNNLGFNEPGAEYEVDGYTFQCTSEKTWTVKNGAMTSELEVLSSEPLGMLYRWTGSGSQQSESKDTLASYKFDFIFDWKYLDDPTNYFMEKTQRGHYDFSIFYNGEAADWVECDISGATGFDIDTRTSRD